MAMKKQDLQTQIVDILKKKESGITVTCWMLFSYAIYLKTT